MRLTSEQSKTLTISLPLRFYQGLERAALDNDRSKNYLIKKAVENYLEDLFLVQKAEKILAKKEPSRNLSAIIKEHRSSPKNALPNKTKKIRGKKS